MQDAVLRPVLMHQAFQQPFPLDGQLNENLAAVFRTGAPFDQTQPLRAVDQLNHTVMIALELLSKLSDRSEVAFGKPFDGKDKVILLGSNTLVANRFLAVAQKSAKRMPEGGNPLKLSLR